MPRPKTARRDVPPHVHCVRAGGREYYYFQANRNESGVKERVRLPGEPMLRDGTPNAEWWAEYRKLAGEPVSKAGHGTFGALITAYKASPEWKELSERTKGLWAPLLGKVNDAWAALPVRGLEAKHVLALRDAHAKKPGMANNLIRALSSMMAWSVPRGWRDNNPCFGLRKLKTGVGYAPWSMAQIEYLREHGKSELWWAAAVALYSGQRQADCLAMLWSDVDSGVIAVVQQKTGKKLRVPMHRDLRAVLDMIPRRSVTILSNTLGKPWTVDGFKTSWGKELAHMPELRGLVFHGLRKSAVVMMLEAGCTDAEVSGITGQSRKMVEHYARMVNQERLAAAAVLKWENAH
jgi:hypothetical protein